MDDKVTLTHQEGMAFEVDVNGLKMVIDTSEEFGGSSRGPRPKSLMLVALGGCTGIDVVSILHKMRIPFDSLRVSVDGSITEDHPRHFDKMHVTYYVGGKDLSHDKVEKAVMLSQEKFCGVTFNYKSSVEITHEIIYTDETNASDG